MLHKNIHCICEQLYQPDKSINNFAIILDGDITLCRHIKRLKMRMKCVIFGVIPKLINAIIRFGLFIYKCTL